MSKALRWRLWCVSGALVGVLSMTGCGFSGSGAMTISPHFTAGRECETPSEPIGRVFFNAPDQSTSVAVAEE